MVFDHLEFSTATELLIYSPSQLDYVAIIFLKMTHVEELHVQGNDGLRDDIGAEYLTLLDQRQSPRSPVIFPRLCTQYLYNLSFVKDDDLIHV
jgi:hypothetical protein